MNYLKFFAITLIIITFVVIILACSQTKLIFYPGKLSKDYKFVAGKNEEEVFLKTKDGETINGLFFTGDKKEVILYFHGNAGDLSSWQFVAQDIVSIGYNFFIIDYRGYGKSTGKISEKGLYDDAEAAYQFLINEKKISPRNLIIYGRSIGSGVAVDLASKHETKGLILEAPCTSLNRLANQKVPFLLPFLYLRYHFDNIGKINKVKSPVLFFHGTNDSVIPVSHTNKLYERFKGKKGKILIEGGEHNDLSNFPEYHQALSSTMPTLFQ